MSVVWTMPGKLGDALLQFPVARLWAETHGKQIALWLDRGSLQPAVRIFEAQPVVESVKLIDGVTSYHCGGQPWHFDLKSEDHAGQEIYHLGMRAFPGEQITLQTLKWLPFQLDRDRLAAEPSLMVPDPAPASNRLVLHGTFQSHMAGTPGFWRFLSMVRDELEADFERIHWVGTDEEIDRALELYPDYEGAPGDCLDVAHTMANARLVIAAGSSMAALAGALKVPCLRVHDDIGQAPRVIWSNLGANQWNETERALRKRWPQIRASIREQVTA